MKNHTKLPELLAPAGSPEALDAAIAGGADAVYFGGALFNARMNAKNFAGESLKNAIDKCRLYGVKTNITLNTLVHDREMADVLRYVEELYTLGADALIVADLGAARLIRQYFPEIELHASTQAIGHNIAAAEKFAEMGFSRMVAARELSFENLRALCQGSPIETELFIHGAICVSQSGGCLASSLIGGRSGNRGECAQPCRLPYKSCQKNCRESYALSLKDICLASHIPEILSLGAASLKIEGRMKSPDYVYGVTKIYRKLLNEGRNASEAELAELKALFSRSGFTDGYFTSRIDRKMLGIRTDADKSDSAALTSGKGTDYEKLMKDRRRPINMRLRIEADKPASLTAELDGHSVTVMGAVPDKAVNQPMTYEAVQKNLEKLGNKPFIPGSGTIHLDDGLIMPLSAINALRREAVDGLCEKILKRRAAVSVKLPDSPAYPPTKPSKTARFLSYESIPEVCECDTVYLPLEKFTAEMTDKVNGIIIPPVVLDSEADKIRAMLKAAADSGIRHALVSNVGHLKLATDAGMTAHGDFRLNIYNRHTAAALYELGFADLTASAELTLPQLRDLGLTAVTYGRIPLMTLEKCVIRDLYSCDECKRRGTVMMTDRKGVSFPLTRAFDHRNIMYNSVPVFMQDRRDDLTKYRITGKHFIFTDETPERIKRILSDEPITADGAVRRISK